MPLAWKVILGDKNGFTACLMGVNVPVISCEGAKSFLMRIIHLN